MQFSITFQRRPKPQLYRAQVEILQQTDERIRLVVRAGGKELYMDKYPFKKNNQWEVVAINFTLGDDTQGDAMLILEIQKAIDHDLAQL